MLDVVVLLRNSPVPLRFQAMDFKYSSDDNGNLVAYEISTVGTKTALIYLNPNEVIGITVTGDTIIAEGEPVAD